MKPPALLTLIAILACTAQAGEISIDGVDGNKYRPLADAGQAATVLFFIQHDCPVANGFAPVRPRRILQPGAGQR